VPGLVDLRKAFTQHAGQAEAWSASEASGLIEALTQVMT
jgi:hypothetical protein